MIEYWLKLLLRSVEIDIFSHQKIKAGLLVADGWYLKIPVSFSPQNANIFEPVCTTVVQSQGL